MFVYPEIRVRARDVAQRFFSTIESRLRYVLSLRTCICVMRKRKDTCSHTLADGPCRKGEEARRAVSVHDFHSNII